MNFFDRFLRKSGKQGVAGADEPAKAPAKDPKSSYRRYRPTLKTPKAPAPAPKAAPAPPPPPAGGTNGNGRKPGARTNRPAAKRRKRRILLLDDDVQLCEVLASLFQWHGYEVTAVQRGVEGVQEIMKTDFDAIVCDFVMPAMRGDVFYVAVERVKPELCRRFIFITGNADDPQVMLFLRSHGCPVIFKPLDTTTLLGTIEGLIERETGVRESGWREGTQSK